MEPEGFNQGEKIRHRLNTICLRFCEVLVLTPMVLVVIAIPDLYIKLDPETEMEGGSDK